MNEEAFAYVRDVQGRPMTAKAYTFAAMAEAVELALNRLKDRKPLPMRDSEKIELEARLMAAADTLRRLAR